jgi:WD40 repeat protein
MSGAAALEAVKGPGKVLIDETVAEEVVRWVAGAVDERALPAGTPLDRLKVEPALLSLFCRELNNARLAQGKSEISLEQTQRESILERFYENCMQGVRPEVRKFVEDKLLTRPGDQRDSEALQALDPTPTPEFLEDLKKLHELRLLRIERRDGLDRVELTHDVLVAVVKANRDRRKQREDLERQWYERHEVEKKRRNRRAVLALSLLSLVALTGAVIGGLGFLRARQSANLERQAKDKAVDAKGQAETARRQAVTALAQADARAAASLVERSLVESGRAAEGLAYLAHAVQTDPKNLFARSSILSLLLQRSWPLPLSCLAPGGKLLAAGMGPAGKVVAASPIPQPGTAGEPKKEGIRFWEAAGDCPRSVRTDVPLGFSPSLAALSADGKRLIAAAGDGRWGVVTVSGLQPKVSPAPEAGISDLEVSPSGRLVAFATATGKVGIWSTESLLRVGQPLPLDVEISLLAFSPDDQMLAVATTDYLVRVWRVGEEFPRFTLSHEGLVRCVRFDAAGRRLVTASADQKARIWDSQTGSLLTTLQGHKDVVRWAELSPDGQTAATASFDHTARLWSVATGKQLGRSLWHRGRVQSVRFSSNGRLLLTASSDSTARVWEVSTLSPVGEPLRLTGALTWADFTADGRKALTISPQMTPSSQGTTLEQETLWEVQPGVSLSYRLKPPPGAVSWTGLLEAGAVEPVEGMAVDWDPSRRRLAAFRDGVLRLWELRDPPVPPRQLVQGVPAGALAASLALSPGGELAALAWNQEASGEEEVKGVVRVVDLKSSKTVAELKGSALGSVAFSSDGGSLLVAHRDGTMELYDPRNTAAGAVRPAFHYPGSERLASARLSPDRSAILTASWDWSARLLDPRTGKPIGKPMQHLGRVFSALYGGLHGEWLVTASSDETARVWDSSTAEPHSDWLRHQAQVWSARLSLDGQRVVTAASDGRVRLWDTTSSQQIGDDLVSFRPAVAAFFLQPDILLSVADDGTVELWDSPTGQPSDRDGDLLKRLAEGVGGYRVENGIVKPATDRISLLDGLREEPRPDRPDKTSLQAFLEWFFADRATRPPSPSAPRARLVPSS